MGEEGKVMLFRMDRGIKNSDQGGISGSEEQLGQNNIKNLKWGVYYISECEFYFFDDLL